MFVSLPAVSILVDPTGGGRQPGGGGVLIPWLTRHRRLSGWSGLALNWLEAGAKSSSRWIKPMCLRLHAYGGRWRQRWLRIIRMWCWRICWWMPVPCGLSGSQDTWTSWLLRTHLVIFLPMNRQCWLVQWGCCPQPASRERHRKGAIPSDCMNRFMAVRLRLLDSMSPIPLPLF